MWTQLLYLTYNDAVKRGLRLPQKKWIAPSLSGRYRKLLGKEFRKYGLPVFWDVRRYDLSNKHNKPTGKKFDLVNKKEREMKIRNLLSKADDEIKAYRQNWVNKRRNRGVEEIIDQILPDWLDTAKTMQKNAEYARKLAEKEYEKGRESIQARVVSDSTVTATTTEVETNATQTTTETPL